MKFLYYKHVYLLLAITGVASFVSFTSNFIISHYIGVVDFSNFAFGMTIISLICSISLIGLPQYLVRTKILDNENESIFFRGVITSFIIFIVLVISLNLIFELDILYFILFGLVMLLSVISSAFYQSKSQFYKMSFFGAGKDFARLLFTILVVLNLDFIDFKLSIIFGSLLVFVILYFMFEAEFTDKEIALIKLEEFKKTFPFFVSGVAYTIYYQSDIILISYNGYIEELSSYSLAISTCTACIVIPSAFYNRYLSTVFYKAYKVKSSSGIIILKKHTRYVFLVVLILAWFYGSYGKVLLDLIIDEKYEYYYEYLNILILSVYIRLLCMPISLLFNLEQGIKYQSNIQVVAAIFNLILNYLFIPVWGVVAAAYSTVATEFLVLFGLFCRYKLRKVF